MRINLRARIVRWCAGRLRKEYKVKVLNSKGIANHTGPESCVTHREVRDEALTGELAGQPLSREIFKLVQGADAVIVAEGNTDGNVSASAWLTLRGLRIWYVGTLFAREPGDLLPGRFRSHVHGCGAAEIRLDRGSATRPSGNRRVDWCAPSPVATNGPDHRMPDSALGWVYP